MGILLAILAFLLLTRKSGEGDKKGGLDFSSILGGNGLGGGADILSMLGKLGSDSDRTSVLLELLSNPLVMELLKNIIGSKGGDTEQESQENDKGQEAEKSADNTGQRASENNVNADHSSQQNNHHSQSIHNQVNQGNSQPLNQDNDNQNAVNVSNVGNIIQQSSPSPTQPTDYAQSSGDLSSTAPQDSVNQSLFVNLSNYPQRTVSQENANTSATDSKEYFFAPIDKVATFEIKQELYKFYDNWYIR